MEMVEDLHGPDYDWHQFFTDCSDTGHCGVARKRTYCIAAHSSLTTCLHDPFELWDSIRSMIFSRVQTSVSDYFVATQYEVLLEAQQFAIRRKIPFQPGQLDLSYLLTSREKQALADYKACYRARFNEPAEANANLVVFLGDNPAYSLTWSATSGKIPCYRLNSANGVLWSPFLRRWVTGKERLVSMGWPVHPQIAAGMNVPQIPASDCHRASDLAGNSMHFSTVAAFQLLSLACWGPTR